jgi:hypothetical protein
MLHPRLRAGLPALLFILPAVLPAEDPTPEAIMDKFIEATGGRAAYEKVKTEVATGTLELTSMGMSGTLTSYKSAPDKNYTVIDFAGMGKAEEGSNGEVAWKINGMEGSVVKKGDERAVALRNGALNAELRWKDFYKKAELAGSEDVGGKPCYKVVLTPNEGDAETRYYDKTTHLLTKVVVPTSTANGPMTVELTLADYKEEDGITSPHTINQKVPNMDIVIKIDNVKRNVDIPANRFDLPDDIKAAAAKK